MATALLIAGVVGAGAQAYSSYQQGKNAQSAIGQQGQIAQNQLNTRNALLKKYLGGLMSAYEEFGQRGEEIVAENKATIEDSYGRINKIISEIPGIEALFPDAEKFSKRDFDFRDAIKKQNLDFILGDTKDDLREAQSLNTALAALEPEIFQGKFNRILKSDILGLKAMTVGEPTGSFANLSAKNLFDFSRQGLSNALAINDFFAKEGTVDPISPLQIAFDLRRLEEGEADRYIGNERWRGESLVSANNALLGVEAQKLRGAETIANLGLNFGGQTQDAYANNMINLSTAGMAAQNATSQGYARAINSLIGAIGGYYSLGIQNQALQQQRSFNTNMINQALSSPIGSKYGGSGQIGYSLNDLMAA